LTHFKAKNRTTFSLDTSSFFFEMKKLTTVIPDLVLGLLLDFGRRQNKVKNYRKKKIKDKETKETTE